MPLILGGDIEIEIPFPRSGCGWRWMGYGSRAVAVTKEVLHPDSDTKRKRIRVVNL